MIKITNLESDSLNNCEIDNVQYLRLSLENHGLDQVKECAQKHLYLYDRMLDVAVPLKNRQNDFSKKIRLKAELFQDNDKQELLKIAYRGFTDDSRFRIPAPESELLYKNTIQYYMDQAEATYVCRYKDLIIAFANITFIKDGTVPFFHLVAVDEKYRMMGAALSLYSNVCQIYGEQGYTSIEGKISTKNTAVMNLYGSLGGIFKNPQDIYVKME